MKALIKQSVALSGLLTLSALSSANTDGETPTFYADALPVFQKIPISHTAKWLSNLQNFIPFQPPPSLPDRHRKLT